MKTILKEIVARTARSRLVWPVYQACGALSGYLRKVHGHASYTRQNSERDHTLLRIESEVFPGQRVSHGPFEGIVFPKQHLPGSTLMPKLLGSYESELHEWMETLIASDYTAVVNIGCAEGYYAIGMACRCPNAQVYAYDIDTLARRICSEMANLNGVSDRVHVGGFCDRAVLKSLALGRKALVLADCEGYERALFDSEMAQFLCQHDVIIETHDFVDINISVQMRNVFSATHEVCSVRSKDDIEKTHTYRYSELERYDVQTRRMMVAERRPAIMEWLVMTPKKTQA
jgi:hypothetical protein